MAEVSLQENRSFHARETITVPEGETQVLVTLPEAVPQGKVMELQVELSGRYQDAEP